MFYSLRNKINKNWFNWHARKILQSPPVQCDSASNVLILTQTYHPDLYMFLLASKSFARFLRPRGFVIVDDGLTERDKHILEEHLGHVTFLPIDTVNVGPCPRGGAWERLLSIAKLTAENYVIQLDADTLTLDTPVEVIECVEANQPFTLGTGTGRAIISVTEAHENATLAPTQHVQSVAEQSLNRLKNAQGLKYVRGCAGFAGFPQGANIEPIIHDFSRQMEHLLGVGKWQEWGSEQVTSNFVIANLPNAMILSPDYYPFWKPGINIGQSRFVHFFGTYRFAEGMYVRQSRGICAELKS